MEEEKKNNPEGETQKKIISDRPELKPGQEYLNG